MAAYFDWIDFLISCAVAKHRRPLFINADETAVLYSYQGKQRGVVLRRIPESLEDFVVPKKGPAKRSGQATLISLICEFSPLQSLMPQIIVGNPAKFNPTMLRRVEPKCPRHVRLVTQARGWSDQHVLCTLLSDLASVLEPWAERYQAILIWDSFKAHCTKSVITKASALGIWVCIVPPDLTFLLQPLDVACFSAMKGFLKKESHRLSEEGVADSWLQAVWEAATAFLIGRDWGPAFEACGVSACRANLSAELRRRVPGCEHWPSRPHLPEWALVLPNRCGATSFDFLRAVS